LQRFWRLLWLRSRLVSPFVGCRDAVDPRCGIPPHFDPKVLQGTLMLLDPRNSFSRRVAIGMGLWAFVDVELTAIPAVEAMQPVTSFPRNFFSRHSQQCKTSRLLPPLGLFYLKGWQDYGRGAGTSQWKVVPKHHAPSTKAATKWAGWAGANSSSRVGGGSQACSRHKGRRGMVLSPR